MADLKPATRDTCLHCGTPILYGVLEFWEDTKRLITEKQPRYPGRGYDLQTDEQRRKFKEQEEAYDAWMAVRKERGVINAYGGGNSRALLWVHLLKTPVETIDDVSRECPTKAQVEKAANKLRSDVENAFAGKEYNFFWMVATPASWCITQKNEGGSCDKPAKEVIVEGSWAQGTVERKAALCGIHYSHHRRAEKAAKEREEASALEEWTREETEKAIKRLADFGIEASADWQRHYTGPFLGSYTGRVIVDPRQLLEILEENIELF